MNDEINYKNNPLNGVSLKQMLTELSGHYGFDILFAYLNINCFRNNPSVASSVKFLKKTDWAREKVEGFYLYTYKSLPKVSYQQSKLPPRDRIVPDDQSTGNPLVLSLEEAEQLREERISKAAEFDRKGSSNNQERRQVSGATNKKHSGRPGENNSSKPEYEPDRVVKRTTSTADNPWGIIKE